MGIENQPGEPALPGLPEGEPFVPIESVHELSPEPGSTFEVLDHDGIDVNEQGKILAIFNDDKLKGGGYFGVELQRNDSKETRRGKINFDTFREFYNNERIANFTNPSDTETQPLEKRNKDLVEQIQSPQPEMMDPQFASYLQELIDRKGIDQIKEITDKMPDIDKEYLREQMRRGNLPGFIGRMEMIVERATDPEWKVKLNRRLDDSLSDDPERHKRAAQQMLTKFHERVELTSRHYKPKEERDAIAQRELKDLIRKMLGRQ